MSGETLKAVIAEAQRGEAAAFDQLVDAYAGRVFGFLLRMIGSRCDAEDLMQEVFLRVVRMIGSYRHDDRFEPWLFRIAANLARDRLRRVQRAPRMIGSASEGGGESGSNGSPIDDAAGRDEDVDAGLVLAEETEALRRAMSELHEAEREVLCLRHFSQMSFREIADATGVPLGTALARGHRGLLRLRKLMAETDGLDELEAARKDVRPGKERASKLVKP